MSLLDDLIVGAEGQADAIETRARAAGEPQNSAAEAQLKVDAERVRQLRAWAAFARRTPDAVELAPRIP